MQYSNGLISPSALQDWIQSPETFSISLFRKTEPAFYDSNPLSSFKFKYVDRAGATQNEFNPNDDLMLNSNVYPFNRKAEENYVRHFLNGKQLRVGTLEVCPFFMLE